MKELWLVVGPFARPAAMLIEILLFLIVLRLLDNAYGEAFFGWLKIPQHERSGIKLIVFAALAALSVGRTVMGQFVFAIGAMADAAFDKAAEEKNHG